MGILICQERGKNMSASTTNVNTACGLLDRAADKLSGEELSQEQLRQVEIYLRKLLMQVYGGMKK